MSRPERLMRLMQALREIPAPATAETLAKRMEVSKRTLYRDINSLRAAGAGIDGAAGYGFVLVEDFCLPPQSFSQLEVEALVLGLGYVRQRGDDALSNAATSALSKVTAASGELTRLQAKHAISQSRRTSDQLTFGVNMETIRKATRDEVVLNITYLSEKAEYSQREVKPLSIVYLEQKTFLLAWCCTRKDFRKFNLKNVTSASPTSTSFRPHRVNLLRQYELQLSDPKN